MTLRAILREALAQRLARGESRTFAKAEMRGLPMDEASRMARAREMGFDVDTPLYHGTGDLTSFERGFDPNFTGQGNDQLGSGFYLTNRPETASNYTIRRLDPQTTKLGGEGAPGVLPVYARVKNPIRLGNDEHAANNLSFEITREQVADILRRSPTIRDPEMSALGNWHDIWSQGITDEMIDDVARHYAGNNLISIENDFFPGVEGANAFRRALNEVLGYDGVTKTFPNGEIHVVPWEPNQIRSPLAAFDPHNTNRANLLGGFAVGAPVGALTLREALRERAQA